MRRQLLLLVAAVVVAESVASRDRWHRVMAQEPVRLAAADVELFVKQAVEDRFAAKNLPGYNLLGNATRIAVREEMPKPGLKLGDRALPQRDGYEFRLVSEAAVQAEANRTGQAVPFIAVDQPLITGDSATVSLGVDLAVPPKPGSVKLCCCVGEGRFRQVDGRWTFVEWSSMICA